MPRSTVKVKNFSPLGYLNFNQGIVLTIWYLMIIVSFSLSVASGDL
jgi:hypothetical protein